MKKILLMPLAAAAVAALVLSGCSSDKGGSTGDGSNAAGEFSGRTVTVQSWGGDITKAETEAYYKPFEEATGAKVRVVEITAQTAALLKQQVETGAPEWDLVTGFPGETMGQFIEEGLLEELDYSLIPTSAELLEGAAISHALGYEIESAVTTYSTADGVKPLGSMADFFDSENFPGPRMAPNWGTASMQCEMALLADGVSQDELYPLDIERCIEVWERIKPSVSVWFDSGSLMAQTLVQEEVVYCMCWDGRVQQALETNPNWTYNFDGGQSYFVYAGIPKGSANSDVAHALLDFMSGAEAQAKFAQTMGYSPSNSNSVDIMPEELRPYMATSPENSKLAFFRSTEDNGKVNDTNEEVERAFGDFLSR